MTTRTILTIDDEAPIRNSFSAFLEDYGYHVVEAEDGLQGLEIYDREQPDLVLVDLRMPGLDGLGVLKGLKERGANIPVIVVSGMSDFDGAVSAQREGAWDYLLKPIPDLDFLKRSIEKALERSDYLREKEIYQSKLEEEVAERTQALKKKSDLLERSLREVERLSRFREDIVSAVSHEFLTPLNPILALSELLCQHEDDGEKKEMLEAIGRGAGDMKQMVDRMLNLVSDPRIQTQKNFESVSIKDLLDQALISARTNINPSVVELKVTISDQTPTALMTDKTSLMSILKILLDNAVKYTCSGSIHISTRYLESDRIEFEIQDTGPGIPENFLPKIFEPFSKLNDFRGKTQTGLGIGLTVARQICLGIHGQITLKSLEGKGTTASINLPLNPFDQHFTELEKF